MFHAFVQNLRILIHESKLSRQSVLLVSGERLKKLALQELKKFHALFVQLSCLIDDSLLMGLERFCIFHTCHLSP